MVPITGVYAAAVTPRRLGSQDINLGAMWDVVDFLVEHGVEGIVLMGSTGEFVHYSSSERMRMVGLAPKRSRVPVIVNVSHSTLDGTLELAQAAAASGASAVLVMPPYFFKYNADDLASFYEQFARDAAIDIPVLLYNIPLFTNSLPFTVSERLIVEGLVQGVKDSSGDMESYRQMAALRKQKPFTFMMGSDSLFVHARREQGIDGVVSGVASALPELLVALNRAIGSGSQEIVTRLEARLQQFIGWADRLAVPVCVREAAAMRGLKVGPHAVPALGAQERPIAQFREWFGSWLSDVQRECRHA
jgi:dihydrodipicolinate synthase/N-acetylneuraminate lyase